MSSSAIPISLVDAFANRPFSGNPAAVCLLSREADPAWMQALAAEINLSETAFVIPMHGKFGLRWFTPSVEVDLCGHATLAAAHLLWERKISRPGEIVFHTRCGELRARQEEPRILLDFPATPATPCPSHDALLSALGIETGEILRNTHDYLLRLETERMVRAIDPDLPLLRTIDTRGVIVTAPSDNTAYHFVSRFFAPRAGIDEDPVTGSAHCTLAPYWTAKLQRNQLVGRQISARGGTVHMELQGERVILGGTAVTILNGTVAPPASP